MAGSATCCRARWIDHIDAFWTCKCGFLKMPQTNPIMIFVVLATVLISGCGGTSQEDLIMRAARRPRAAEETEQDAVAAKPAVATAAPVSRQTASKAAVPSVPNPVIPAASSHENIIDQPITAGDENVLPTELLPISRRRPAIPLSEFERRKRSAENLKRIGEALAAYVSEKGRLPLPAMKTPSGIATVSWRVELLPYLGHAELYRAFDVNQPWDSPTNLPLLDLIPDCYVSPDRFDSSTNYLGVAGRTYLFNGEPVSVRKIEDGLENTIAIVEVDDTHAAPWTSPTDYAPARGNLLAGLGRLRPEGTYALWANGWTTRLAADVGEQQLHKAFTYESGDGSVAGDIHNPLMIRELTSSESTAGPASSAKMAGANAATSEGSEDASRASARNPHNGNFASDAAQPRLAVPNLGDLESAMSQVQDLYAERLKSAVADPQRKAIAQEMLAAAADMRDDPAGAYALQSAAARVAVSIGDLATACQAVDAQVAMFEVDPMERNGEMLTLFGSNSLGAGAVDGRAYLQRALPVLYGGIKNNSYDTAEHICQIAIQFEAQSRDRMLLPGLNRLRLQIVAAANSHRRAEAAIAQLRKAPHDPAASSTVGLYLAFTKGDWQRGLPLLAAGDDERLAQIAKTDLATAASASAMMATADDWWELGEATAQERYRGACRARAAHWYAKAMETMPDSLARMHAEGRLRKSEASGAGTPLDAVAWLARALGVDLSGTPGSPPTLSSGDDRRP